MKKHILVLLSVILLIPFNVFAAGDFGVSTSSVSLYPGDTTTINITSNNSVGKLLISSSNGGVASISTSSVFIQTPGSSQSFTITAGSVGTSYVTVTASNDYASMDEEILAGQTRTVTVNVVNRPSSNNTNNSTNSNSGNTYYQNNNTSNNNTTNNTNQKSTNNTLKELKIDGYELEKIDDNNYKLSVSNGVTNINIKATAEDDKAVVTGTGNHELSVGDNSIIVSVTSESGAENNINILINRKDGYYLEDLDDVINDSSLKDISININAESKLSKSDLEKIKKSGKKLSFNYYDDNKILIYSWSIDGSKIKKCSDIALGINNTSSNTKKIFKAVNYADGIILNFVHDGNFPENTYIKYFVGDKYNDNDKINLYYYDKSTGIVDMSNSNLVVKNGYVEFKIESSSDYFLSMATIDNTESDKNFNWFIVISIIEFIFILLGVIYYLVKIKGVFNKKN